MGNRRDRKLRLAVPVTIAAFCAAVAIGALAPATCLAASIPAWLDEAITSWNERNPTLQFQFAGIKDSFVWYRIQGTPEIGQKPIREAAYRIVQEHGYMTTDDEELVTTGRPPAESGSSTEKKCWRRSFVVNLEKLSDTKEVGGEHSGMRQRMLTSMVCEDSPYWATGFRVAD